MDYDFIGGSYETFSKNLNAQECVNWFVHIDQEGGVNQKSLRGFPGLKSWKDTGEYGEVRGIKRFGTHIYAVVGNKVFRINQSKSSTQCSGTLNTSSGIVSMDANSTQVMIVDGLHGYIVSGTTISDITDDAFPSSPTTVTEQDEFFLVTSDGTGNVNVSDVDDGTSWDSTSYFNANRKPDTALCVLSDHSDIIVFGEDTLESWYDASGTFTRKPGYAQEEGIGAIHSPIKLANNVYFLTNKIRVATIKGVVPSGVSKKATEYQMAQDADISNAIGMGAEIEGNAFYILTTSNNTWCFNAATNEWNTLTSYPEPFTGRWRGNCAERFDNKVIVGDYENGVLYELDFDTFTDNSQPIKRVRTPRTLRQEGKEIFVHCLEIFFESGVGLDGGVQGTDPQAMLEYSIDGCKTWSSEIWRDIGEIGEYQARAEWNRFASGRNWTPRLTISDPVKCVITGANLEATIGIT